MFPQLKNAYNNSGSGKPPEEPEQSSLIAEFAARVLGPKVRRRLSEEYNALEQRSLLPDGKAPDVQAFRALKSIQERVEKLQQAMESGKPSTLWQGWKFHKRIKSLGLNA